jgi:hypothetical protein
MTMHQPSARIITLKRQDQTPTIRQHGHISPHGIHKVQLRDHGFGELTAELSENVEIVTVKMDGVRETTGVLESEEMEFVLLAEIDDVFTNGGVTRGSEFGEVAIENVFDGWVRPFDI